jgi:hypothetical protein
MARKRRRCEKEGRGNQLLLVGSSWARPDVWPPSSSIVGGRSNRRCPRKEEPHSSPSKAPFEPSWSSLVFQFAVQRSKCPLKAGGVDER